MLALASRTASYRSALETAALPTRLDIVALRKRASVGALDQVALRVGDDHGAHRLVIFDVAGTAAEMAVECLRDGLFEMGARHGLFRQTLSRT